MSVEKPAVFWGCSVLPWQSTHRHTVPETCEMAANTYIGTSLECTQGEYPIISF